MGHPPTTPQLLSMKECSREEVLKGKKSQYDQGGHPGGQLDQVDSKIKSMRKSYMIRKMVINHP